MSRFASGKVLLALAAGSIGFIALTAPAVGRPNPRDAESARTEAARTAQLRHARDVRGAARRQTTVQTHPQATRRPATAAMASVPADSRNRRPAFGWPTLVTEARKYIGTNPTAMSRRWCARFMNLVLTKAGYSGTNSDAARSFASYGRRISEPKIGAIAVLSRGKNRNLGHVGIVSGIDANGNPIIISGNHGHRVGEAAYPRSRVIAYVMPTGEAPMTRVALATPAAHARSSDAEPEGLVSPIDELLAAINAEKPSIERVTARSQAPAVAQAQPQPRGPERVVTPTPLPRVRVAQVALPPMQVVPQPRPAPYRLVQQTPAPLPDPRRALAQ